MQETSWLQEVVAIPVVETIQERSWLPEVVEEPCIPCMNKDIDERGDPEGMPLQPPGAFLPVIQSKIFHNSSKSS